jgi:transposase-like protein
MMSQHFLLSTQARTLSLAKVLRLSDEEAYGAFKAIRFSQNGGEAFCPKCGSTSLYNLPRRKMWRCKDCPCQFSVSSGTIFASRKLNIRDILAAIAIFVNGAKGHSALQLSRDLDVQYKTAFVMAHKLREVLEAEQAKVKKLRGEVEIDTAYFGGYIKPANYKKDRIDRRILQNQNGKREGVVVMREREGRTLTSVAKSEHASIPVVQATIADGSTVYADEAANWDVLHARYLTKRINHSECYSDGQACTNMAESFFSRLRRAEIGIHHSLAGPYLAAYAGEMSWREDNRRQSNGAQYMTLASAAAHHPVSRQWKGYWQRRRSA